MSRLSFILSSLVVGGALFISSGLLGSPARAQTPTGSQGGSSSQLPATAGCCTQQECERRDAAAVGGAGGSQGATGSQGAGSRRTQ